MNLTCINDLSTEGQYVRKFFTAPINLDGKVKYSQLG